jgi:uncharacterized membrane protein (UPF0127 family)
MMLMKRALLTLLCAAWFVGAQAADETIDASQLDRFFQRTTLQVATPSARVHTFKVWVADDFKRRARGLMFVNRLADDEGMLFIYEQPQEVSMWMKNTFIPLDMLFVDTGGKVIRVVENTVPHSLETISSQGLALGVIELKGGTAKRLGIDTGARISHPAFRSSK